MSRALGPAPIAPEFGFLMLLDLFQKTGQHQPRNLGPGTGSPTALCTVSLVSAASGWPPSAVGFRPKLGPGSLPTAPDEKTLHNATKINRETEFTAPKSAELKGAPKMFEDPAGNL